MEFAIFNKTRLIRTGLFIFTCLLIGLAGWFRPLERYELLWYDLQMRMSRKPQINKNIAVIEIADDTLNNLGKWPLPRDFYASLIKVLSEYQARAVVFDILFSDPTLYDKQLSAQIQDSGNVFLPVAFDLRTPQYKDGFITSKSMIAGLRENLQKSAAGTGHINVIVDPDGKIRRVPLYINYQNKLVAHLALETACNILKVNPEKIHLKNRQAVIDDSLRIPSYSNAEILVNYPGAWPQSFVHLSFFDILKAYSNRQKGKKADIDLNSLKDKICLIGLTATGTQDLKPTPVENSYPMLGLQASVLNSIIEKDFIIKASPFFNILLNLLIFTSAFLICWRLALFKALTACTALAIFYCLISLGLFFAFGFWIDFILGLALIIFTYIGFTLYRFIDESKKRHLLEKELDIAHQIQESFLPDKISEPAGTKIHPFMKPAKFVAGDLYDIINIDTHKIGVFIGDVSGKGVPAALIMAQTVSLFRIFAKDNDDPAGVLNLLNKELSGVLTGRFVTALYMIIDTVRQTLKVACAGHNPVIAYNCKEDMVKEILAKAGGPPLGISDTIEYTQAETNLAYTDNLIAYTDGISEAKNKYDEEFGIDKIKKILFDMKNSNPGQINTAIYESLNRFTKGCIQHDDITLITICLRNKKEEI